MPYTMDMILEGRVLLIRLVGSTERHLGAGELRTIRDVASASAELRYRAILVDMRSASLGLSLAARNAARAIFAQLAGPGVRVAGLCAPGQMEADSPLRDAAEINGVLTSDN